MAAPRRSFSERVRATSFFRNRSVKIVRDSFLEDEPQSAPLPPASDYTPQLGLLAEDLELTGKHVGKNLAAMLTQSLYQDQDLRASAKCSKPTAVSAEEMILQAFGPGENTGTTKAAVQPTLVAFVKGIMQALQDQTVKADMEHYAKRRAAQSILQASESLQQKGEEIGNMALDGVAMKVHNSKPVPDDSLAFAGPSFTPPPAAAPIKVIKAGSEPSTRDTDVYHEQARTLQATSQEGKEEMCIDPDVCGIKPQTTTLRRSKTAAVDEDDDPDLIALVLSPVVAGFNRAFSASSGVARRVFSPLSIENIKDGLTCFLYDKYTAFITQEAVVSKLRDLGSKSAHKLLDALTELDEPAERNEGEEMELAADETDTCGAHTLLPPLLEPILAGILDVLKSKEHESKRKDAIWSLARWWCWRREIA